MDVRKVLASGAIVAGLVTGMAGGADASPKNGFAVALDCGEGGTYELDVVPGRGNWSPAHESGSNRVFHPTRFDGFEGTFTDPEGAEETFSEDFVDTRGSSHDRRSTLDCTYSFEELYEDGSTFEGSGGVSGYFSGR